MSPGTSGSSSSSRPARSNSSAAHPPDSAVAGTGASPSVHTATEPAATVLKGTMDTDVALAHRLAADLDAAFPTLVAAHADRLYSIALRLLGDPRDAEEVAQDALVRAFRAIQGYPAARTSELRLRPWLASITVNLARNRRRRIADRQPPVRLEPLVEAGLDLPDLRTPGPPAVVARRESVSGLATTLLQLPAPI